MARAAHWETAKAGSPPGLRRFLCRGSSDIECFLLLSSWSLTLLLIFTDSAIADNPLLWLRRSLLWVTFWAVLRVVLAFFLKKPPGASCGRRHVVKILGRCGLAFGQRVFFYVCFLVSGDFSPSLCFFFCIDEICFCAIAVWRAVSYAVLSE